ncbi:N-acetyl-alpha-D-glucosaminyl L-malate synthase BshA [Candidatus Obscuribacterales bacterium]|nr:N-acetyl-alpha-D-glucosaminyl L-malate synthase BshA [Candidatus Obscuribacterales bacterium]MBX3150930.1 N-acetyl-alpha-D-glucosaminyl L-malate synthase BshA [Candidatus Obscuribacterales bacterium]
MTPRNPLKIGISCYPSVGGSGVIATTLGIELAQRGHEVHFISYERPFRLPENAPRIHFHQVVINSYGLFKYPDYTLPLSVEMARVSCVHDLDIMHVHYAVPHATAAILARCMLPQDKQPKVVTTLHGTDTTLLGADPGYGPAIHHALTQSDAVTNVSSFLEAETQRVIGYKGAMQVIYNFFEPKQPLRTREDVRRELGVGDEVLILHSSNLRPMKRVDMLLETVSRIQPRDKVKLLILAGADFKPFSDDVSRLGLADSIIVRENVLDIEEYLQAADLSLYTSESESFCLSILEAMFFGCPSVATNVGGIPEVVENGVDGLLVPFGDVDGLAREVQRLVDDVDERKKLGAAALANARKRFSADAIIPQYEDLYWALLRKPPVAAGSAVVSCSDE